MVVVRAGISRLHLGVFLLLPLGLLVQLPIPGHSSFLLAVLLINHELMTYEM